MYIYKYKIMKFKTSVGYRINKCKLLSQTAIKLQL